MSKLFSFHYHKPESFTFVTQNVDDKTQNENVSKPEFTWVKFKLAHHMMFWISIWILHISFSLPTIWIRWAQFLTVNSVWQRNQICLVQLRVLSWSISHWSNRILIPQFEYCLSHIGVMLFRFWCWWTSVWYHISNAIPFCMI